MHLDDFGPKGSVDRTLLRRFAGLNPTALTTDGEIRNTQVFSSLGPLRHIRPRLSVDTFHVNGIPGSLLCLVAVLMSLSDIGG